MALGAGKSSLEDTDMSLKTVPSMLRESAQTYEERNKLYGDNYKLFGHVMTALFPTGLKIETYQQWNQIGIFVQIVSKISRYAENINRGGHDDSLLDLAVYATMLRELDDHTKSVDVILKSLKDAREKSNESPSL